MDVRSRAARTIASDVGHLTGKKGTGKMLSAGSSKRGYVLSALLGAIGGGIAVALATQAIPKMMSGMMEGMAARMQASGCDPGEM